MTVRWKPCATQMDYVMAMRRILDRGYKYTVESGGKVWRISQ